MTGCHRPVSKRQLACFIPRLRSVPLLEFHMYASSMDCLFCHTRQKRLN